MKVFVLGTGAWGIALSILLENNGNNVTMWSAFENEISEITRTRENSRVLPGVKIPDRIKLTTDISEVKTYDAVLLSVPSFAIKDVCEQIKPYISDDMLIINAGKGLEPSSGKRFSQIISETLGVDGIVAISGPTHAEEVSKKVPTSIVAASNIPEKAAKAQDLLMSDYMRVYINDDTVGVELGGALKNIIALCAGICDGIGMGDNTKAALITRGLHEISKLGIAMGGKAETFMGLAGIGDLVVTCCSVHSRNHKAGVLIGKGTSASDAIKEVGTVEGFYALETTYSLAKRLNVEMPIVNACHDIFANGLAPEDAVKMLMNRPKKSEALQ